MPPWKGRGSSVLLTEADLLLISQLEWGWKEVSGCVFEWTAESGRNKGEKQRYPRMWRGKHVVPLRFYAMSLQKMP